MIRRSSMFIARVAAAAPAGGVALLLAMASAAPASAAGATTWTVDVGAGDATGVAVQQFFPNDITVDAGDSITFRAAGNAHTVSFLAPGQTAPSPDSADAVTPAGGTSVDGTAFTSSGLLLPAPNVSYTLTFPTAGAFQFHCLIHPWMSGTVHVQAAGTAYPQTAADITAANATAEAAGITTGHQMEAAFKPTSTVNANGTTTWHLAAGVGSNSISILRYIQGTLKIHVGYTVEWTTGDSNGEPHSVSFGTEPQGPAADAPAGGTTYPATGFVSSGLFLAAPLPGPHSYSVTFTKAGTYPYFCVLHDIIGMKGTISVAAAVTPGGGATLPPTNGTPAGGAAPPVRPLPALLVILGAAALAGAAAAARRRSRALASDE